MPAKNIVKVYVKEGYYHIYNRGVEKRKIFEDKQDYKVFITYLKEYLSTPQKTDILKTTFTLQGSTFKGVPRQPKNYNKKLELLAYCLMPNHFHLLVKQDEKMIIKSFMQSLSTRYSMYFNKKHDRIGTLFQGIYKAVLITEDNYLLHLSRYIHLNPLKNTDNLVRAYSSYADYLGLRNTKWVKPEVVLAYFNKPVSKEFLKVSNYKDFVENYKKDSIEILGRLILEE